MKTILVGYDGTRPAGRALERAAELAQAFGAKILVVSVAAPDPLPSTGAFGLLPYYELTQPRQTHEPLWDEHRRHVEAFFAGAGVEADFAGVAGLPAEAIVELAEEHEADLIVVGTREPGFLERLLGGSVSEGVARRAGCDVLIVHPADDDAA